MPPAVLPRFAAFLLLAGAFCGLAQAASKRPRFGFQNFGATYTGGYSIVTSDNSLAGPAEIRIRAAKDGRSATAIWKNTFYTPRGSYKVSLRWSFLPNGDVLASSIDPRAARPSARGSFKLDRNRPIHFFATSVEGAAAGELRLVGGGALSITVTFTDLTGSDVTYSFSGGRKR